MIKINAKIGLQAKITIAVILTTVIILSLTEYFLNVRFQYYERLDQMKNSAFILSSSLEKSIITTDSFFDQSKLQELVNEYNKIKGVEEVYIFDNNFKIIAHANPKFIDTYYKNKDAIEAIKFDRQATEFKFEKLDKKENGETSKVQVFDVVTPIHEYGQIVGGIEVELSMEPVNTLQSNSMFFSMATVVITSLVLGLILVLLLYQIVLKRLSALVNATSEVAAGNFDINTEIDGNDEINELNNSFQQMIISLKHLREKDKSSNPLTGLPGNIDIHEEIDNRIEENLKFTSFYLDIDNFKAFNDYYGFGQGDKAIIFTADIIKNAVSTLGNPDDFIGHIGGDDFVIISSTEQQKILAEKIINDFDTGIKTLYKEEDIKRGYINITDRAGVVRSFPILSISIAMVDNSEYKVSNALELAEIAAERKKEAKGMEGSVYI